MMTFGAGSLLPEVKRKNKGAPEQSKRVLSQNLPGSRVFRSSSLISYALVDLVDSFTSRGLATAVVWLPLVIASLL